MSVTFLSYDALFSISVQLLDSVRNLHNSTLSTRNRTLNQDDALLSINLDDLGVLDGHILETHMTSHLLTRQNSTRILTRTHRTSGTMLFGGTVGSTETVEMMTLHNTSKTFAL